MRRLFFILAIFLIASSVLWACGGGPAKQTSNTDSSASHDYYEPEGPTVHFGKVGEKTVNVSLSNYVSDNPAESFQVVMTGEKDSPTEGMVVSFPWKQEETYKPELLLDFDRLCNYRWTAVIDGKKAITQHVEEFSDGSCWVEFVFLPEDQQ